MPDNTAAWPPAGSASMAFKRVKETLGFVQRTTRDGETVIYLHCPKCGQKGEIDDDQLHGRVSVVCVNESCGFHETRNWHRSAITTPWEWEVPK